MRAEEQDERLLTGRPIPSSAPIRLRAGEVEVELDGVDLRHVAYRGLEVAQQVYVAIRDVPWNTLPGTVEDLTIEQGTGSSFSVGFRSRHAYAALGVDLEWTGSIEGEADGQIRYEMDLRARRPLEYSRIGFNVLHGTRNYAARPFRASLSGRAIEGRLPTVIAPQAQVAGRLTGIFAPFDQLELSPIDGVIVDFAFEGDEFEMEDQRNFGDSSFKSYSTPLQRPAPFHLDAGETLRQSVTIGIRDDRRRVGRLRPSEPSTIRIGDPTGGHVPPIGLGHASDGRRLSEDERDRVAALRPHHLRIEIPAAEGAAAARERNDGAASEARAFGCGLVVDLVIGSEDRGVLADITRVVCAADPPPAAIFVASRVAEPPDVGVSAAMLAEVREIAAAVAPTTLVGAGSPGFLADVTRAPFNGSVVRALSYPLSPTVHRTDDRSVMENIDGLRDGVQATRRDLGERPLFVGPVTLATRHGPYPSGPSGPGDPPSHVDPRQGSLLAAAWTVGCLAELVGAGVDGLTFYETAGPVGVMDRGTSNVYPVWHVLADLAEWRGASVLGSDIAPPPIFTPDVAALAVRDEDGDHLLVASLTRQESLVTISGLSSGSVRVRTLDTTTAELATTDPLAFRAAPLDRIVEKGRLDVPLRPYGVVRIDLRRP